MQTQSVSQSVSPCPDTSHLERHEAPRLETSKGAKRRVGAFRERPRIISSLHPLSDDVVLVEIQQIGFQDSTKFR